MTVLTYKITSKEGLHARPAARLVKLVSTFKGNVELSYKKTVNMKSMLLVLSLGIPYDATFTITLDGEDEAEMASKLEFTLKEEALI